MWKINFNANGNWPVHFVVYAKTNAHIQPEKEIVTQPEGQQDGIVSKGIFHQDL